MFVVYFISTLQPYAAEFLLLVTTDGSDECGPKDISCGLNSKDLASIMKEHFGTSKAMSMDQGGSTTLWYAFYSL